VTDIIEARSKILRRKSHLCPRKYMYIFCRHKRKGNNHEAIKLNTYYKIIYGQVDDDEVKACTKKLLFEK